MRKLIITLSGFLCCLALSAQQTPSDAHRLTLETLFQAFSRTNNTAGMGLSQPTPGSKTQLMVFDQTGDHHLAQQGTADYGFQFSTLRYDSFTHTPAGASGRVCLGSAFPGVGTAWFWSLLFFRGSWGLRKSVAQHLS